MLVWKSVDERSVGGGGEHSNGTMVRTMGKTNEGARVRHFHKKSLLLTIRITTTIFCSFRRTSVPVNEKQRQGRLCLQLVERPDIPSMQSDKTYRRGVDEKRRK